MRTGLSHRFLSMLILAGLALMAQIGAGKSPAAGFMLVTAAEYKQLQSQSSSAAPEEGPVTRGFDPNAPKIIVDAPDPSADIKPPLKLALRFQASPDAPIDVASFQVIYKLGPVRKDITDRVRPFLNLTPAGATGNSVSAVPPGDHTIIIRIQDTLHRTGEQTVTFHVRAV